MAGWETITDITTRNGILTAKGSPKGLLTSWLPPDMSTDWSTSLRSDWTCCCCRWLARLWDGTFQSTRLDVSPLSLLITGWDETHWLITQLIRELITLPNNCGNDGKKMTTTTLIRGRRRWCCCATEILYACVGGEKMENLFEQGICAISALSRDDSLGTKRAKLNVTGFIRTFLEKNAYQSKWESLIF